MNRKYKEFIKSAVQQEAENRKKLVDEFGPPGFEKPKGMELNEPFWSAYYAEKRTKIIFEPDEKRFYAYDPATGIFVPKSPDTIRTELSTLVQAGAKWDGYGMLTTLRNEKHLRGILAHLRGQVEARDFFHESLNVVHLGNCTLKFDDGGFIVEGFSPDHHSRNRSPINYVKNAKCPDFQEKLLGHLPSEDRLLIQKIAGQCLLGRNLIQRFLILDGKSNASKSALIEVITGVVGIKNVYELRTKHLAERFEIGRMIGKTLLTGSDVRSEFLTEQGAYRIKTLVGGDQLEAELKCSNEHFYIYGTFNLLISANTRLRLQLQGDRGAWGRRLTLVRYEQPYIGQRIPEIARRLIEGEGPGILNWCLQGLELLFQDIRIVGDIILSDRQKKLVEDLLSESDSLGFFIKDYVISDFTKPPGSNGKNGAASYSVTFDEITDRYIEYCRDKGWNPLPATRIKEQLPDLMIRQFGVAEAHSIKRGGKEQRGFRNVRILPPTE
jgi:phage/plasmid-associated DNA primase